MATYTATAAQTAVQPKTLRVGLTAVRSVYSAGSTSQSIGTTVNMVKVPPGATVVYMQYGVLGMADGTLHIGDSIVPGRYRSVATYSAGLGMLISSIVQSPYTYSADDTIFMQVSLVSASTLTGAYYMNVVFSMDV